MASTTVSVTGGTAGVPGEASGEFSLSLMTVTAMGIVLDGVTLSRTTWLP